MPDDKTKTGAQDRARISLSQEYELRGWANHFGVKPDDIRAAVEAVGSDVKAVEAYLKRKR